MSPWWPSLKLLSCCPAMSVSGGVSEAHVKIRGCFTNISRAQQNICVLQKSYFLSEFQAETLHVCPCFGHMYQVSAWNSHHKCDFWHCIFSRDYFGELTKRLWYSPQAPVDFIYVCLIFKWVAATWLNTLKPRQNGYHLADNILKCILENENVPKSPTDNTPALFLIMAWRRAIILIIDGLCYRHIYASLCPNELNTGHQESNPSNGRLPRWHMPWYMYDPHKILWGNY